MTTFKAALQEACFMELEDIPPEEELSTDETLTFSPAFEKKMKKLIRRADHPIRHRVAQAAACLLLAALLGGTVLAISPEARAAFVGWVREVYETWFVYRYVGENPTFSENTVYAPMWLPEGYELVIAPEPRDHMVAIYENHSNDKIIFNCYKNTESMNLQIGQQGTLLQQVYVGDTSADLYVDSVEGDINHLVWEDSKEKVIFWLSSTLDGETMVKIAESVQEIPKPQVIYRPVWLPEGYRVVSENIGKQTFIIYESEGGEPALFAYARISESFTLNIDRDGREIGQSVFVGDNPADLYIDQDTDENNILVWTDERKGLVFYISAQLDSSELIKMAESVAAQKVPEPQVIYQPTWIPDGFTESERSESGDLTYFFYEDENFNLISFAYSQNTESSSLYLERNDVDVQTVQIGDLYADLYLDQNPGNANGLVWTDMGILFWIHGNCSGEELIKIAESIVAQEVPEQEVS